MRRHHRMRSSNYRVGGTLRPSRACARIAWRDLRSSPARFLFAIAAIALGVATLGGIQGAIAAFQTALSQDLKQWIAADVSVQTAEPPDRRQTALLRSMDESGIERTVVVDTTAQVTSDATPDPQLVMAKVVDPSKYPFYGRVELIPPSSLPDALSGPSVAVSADLLGRLHAQIGSVIEVNAQKLRISAVIRAEPDRLTLTPTPLPRIMLAYTSAEATGLVRPRTSYYLRILFRLPPGTSPETIRHSLEDAFPGRKVLDYLHPDPQAAGILQKLQRSLGAISIMVLLVGVIAVATAMWSHIEQRLDSIAVMKALGATSGRVSSDLYFSDRLPRVSRKPRRRHSRFRARTCHRHAGAESLLHAPGGPLEPSHAAAGRRSRLLRRRFHSDSRFVANPRSAPVPHAATRYAGGSPHPPTA